MNSPFFSVVIPLYNKEIYIEKTLQSVITQTFRNFEIIIIDDGSSDKSCEIVKSIKDQRINLIRQKNGGPSKARNRGIKEAKGQFIAFLDADDEWMPGKLQAHYLLAEKNSKIVWFSTGFRAEGGKREEKILYECKRIIDDALEALIDGMVIQTSTVVINRSAFDDNRLLFNEFVRRSEDREVWLKMACLFPQIGYIKNILSVYRVNSKGSLSTSGISDMDFSFLLLPERMGNILSLIKINRKEKILSYFTNYNIERILSIWGWTGSYKYCKHMFVGHVNYKILAILGFFDFLPVLIKKILVKMYMYYKKHKGNRK